MLRCISVPNLAIVISIGGELWHGHGLNFDFGVQFDFECQGQSPPTPPPPTPTPHPPTPTPPWNNRDLNQGLLHLWSKFGDPSLNGWWVIAPTSTWLVHTQTDTQADRRRQTDTQTDRSRQRQYRKPNLASGNKNSNVILITVIPVKLNLEWHGRQGTVTYW